MPSILFLLFTGKPNYVKLSLKILPLLSSISFLKAAASRGTQIVSLYYSFLLFHVDPNLLLFLWFSLTGEKCLKCFKQPFLKRRKGVSTIIGIVFLVIILVAAVLFMNWSWSKLITAETRARQEMAQHEAVRKDVDFEAYKCEKEDVKGITLINSGGTTLHDARIMVNDTLLEMEGGGKSCPVLHSGENVTFLCTPIPEVAYVSAREDSRLLYVKSLVVNQPS